jgi:hypothetical protein
MGRGVEGVEKGQGKQVWEKAEIHLAKLVSYPLLPKG